MRRTSATDHYGGKATGLWFVLAVPALTYVVVVCLFGNATGVPATARALGIAVGTIIIAYLTAPVIWKDEVPRTYADSGIWSLVTAILSAALAMVHTPVATWSSLALPLAAGVLSICLLLGSLTIFLTRSIRIPATVAHRAVLVVLLLCVTAPLWLSPFCAALASQFITDLVLAVSPIGYLASLTDFDPLRSSWFYTNTPLGGLRYDYPDPVLLTAVYWSLAMLLPLLHTPRLHRLSTQAITHLTSLRRIHKGPTS